MEIPFRVSAIVRPECETVAVGYVIPRRVGNAVVRNRLRRQLREVMALLDRRGSIPHGAFVLSVEPHEPLAFSEMGRRIDSVMNSVATGGAT